jgi:predicted GNAT family N-acyltransferase
MNPLFQLVPGSWQEHREALTDVRLQVFVVEQRVPDTRELDGYDAHCNHVLVTGAANRPVGAGRLKVDGHIGRMAVLADCRRQGIGSAILEALLAVAREQQHPAVYLPAQLMAIGFIAGSVLLPAVNPSPRLEFCTSIRC